MSVLPLSGKKVLSLALNLPGPLAATRLQRIGAEVVKIEPPEGDLLASLCPDWYQELCAMQQVICLDLKDTAGQTILAEHLTSADLLITSMRLSALSRVGLDWEALHARFPLLCQVAIVGYPDPNGDRPGHDLTYQAETGLVAPPALPYAMIADMAGAERAVSAALALLIDRERSGVGSYAEVSLFEVARWFAKPVDYSLTVTGQALGGGLPEYNLYRAKSGWIAVAALESQFRQKLFEAMGCREREALQGVFMTRNALEWQSWAEDHDLPIAAVKRF